MEWEVIDRWRSRSRCVVISQRKDLERFKSEVFNEIGYIKKEGFKSEKEAYEYGKSLIFYNGEFTTREDFMRDIRKKKTYKPIYDYKKIVNSVLKNGVTKTKNKMGIDRNTVYKALKREGYTNKGSRKKPQWVYSPHEIEDKE